MFRDANRNLFTATTGLMKSTWQISRLIYTHAEKSRTCDFRDNSTLPKVLRTGQV